MKVIFECEECGRDLLVYHPTDLHRPTFDAAECDLRTVITQLTCPDCAKLTYGPITQDMMAEALGERSKSCNDVEDDYYECEARFVLRLLNDLYPQGGRVPFPPSDGDRDDWRDWLLNLARQK